MDNASPSPRPAVRSVLVCGASGFVGRRVVRALREAGLAVTAGSSRTHDFQRDLTPEAWLPRVTGFDAVVNAVGLLRDTPRRKLEPIHHQAPAALFEACARAGVTRVIQISANGVECSPTRYASTKRAADEALLRLLQDGGPEVVTAVGPRALSLADYIGELRRQLGHGPARVIPLPDAPSRWSARLGDLVSSSPWSSESLSLLEQDNVGDSAAFERVLGRAAVPVERFVEAAWASDV